VDNWSILLEHKTIYIMKISPELISDEMREAGVDENTEFATREEMVEKLGEEKVAEIEAQASGDETPAVEATPEPEETSTPEGTDI